MILKVFDDKIWLGRGRTGCLGYSPRHSGSPAGAMLVVDGGFLASGVNQ